MDAPRVPRSSSRACTDDVIGSAQSDQYSEQSSLQVKRIIDRFKGREGFTDIDRNWSCRVTYVRQWFLFSASERWRDDDTEYEHYTDSAGKSGGQKEKLAYTILAASLAYQFKLDWGAARLKAFRFVVIDEAFGRGSEISIEYALTLFTRLGLQLLIVTPLQKIHVIEPYVSAVGFVDNLDRELLPAANPHHRGVQAASAAAPGQPVRGGSSRVTGPGWTRAADLVAYSAGAGTLGGTSRPTPVVTCGNRSCCRSRGRTATSCCTASRMCASGRPLSKRTRTGRWRSRSDGGRRSRRDQPDTGADQGPRLRQPGLDTRRDQGGSDHGPADGPDAVRDAVVGGLGRRSPFEGAGTSRRLVPSAQPTVEWIAGRDTQHTYLRQIDVEGVDTKFVQRHQKLLSELLLVGLRRSGSTCHRWSSPGVSVF